LAIPDEIDLKILAALNLNPKYSSEEVAYIVDTSIEEVEKRIKRMVEEGIIVSYGLKLRDDVIKMLPPKESLKEVEKKISFKISEIISLANEIHRVFGTGSGIILNYAGIGVGHSIVNDKSFAGGKEVFSVIRKVLEEKGFGKISIELTNSYSGKISFENLPFPKENPIHEVLEMFVRGIFQGFINKVFRTNKVSLIKEQCIAKGDNVCTFSFKIEGGQ